WLSRFASDGTDALAAVTPDGATVIISSTTFDVRSNSEDYVIVAYDAATGTRKWSVDYEGTGHSTDLPVAEAITPDGATVIVTGDSAGTDNRYEYATVALDTATGTKRWVARYRGPYSEDDAEAEAVTPDGGTVIVTGGGDAAHNRRDYATVAYDTANG